MHSIGGNISRPTSSTAYVFRRLYLIPRASHKVFKCLPLDALAAVVEEYGITRIILCGEMGQQMHLSMVFSLLAHHPVSIQYAPDLSGLPVLGLNVSRLDSQPLIDLTACPLDGKAQFIKWMEDKILGSLILLFILPILLLVAIVIKCTSPGPIFFIQHRHGLYGRPIS